MTMKDRVFTLFFYKTRCSGSYILPQAKECYTFENHKMVKDEILGK